MSVPRSVLLLSIAFAPLTKRCLNSLNVCLGFSNGSLSVSQALCSAWKILSSTNCTSTDHLDEVSPAPETVLFYLSAAVSACSPTVTTLKLENIFFRDFFRETEVDQKERMSLLVSGVL